MSVKVLLPTPLRPFADGNAEIQVEAADLRELVAKLVGTNVEFKSRLLNSEGELQKFVNIHLNEENVRFLQKLDTPLKAGDEVSIIPSISGG